jgi:hypothetical protein
MTLIRSNDRKVANAVSPNGKTPAIANTFGLPSGRDYSCGSQTDFCGSICYAGKLEKIYKGVSRILLNNFEALKAQDFGGMVELLTDMIAEFRADCVKRGAPMLFRIHWDGDFFSGTYTAAWNEIIRRNPDIQFWVYTRVAPAALFLHNGRHNNLGLYFSADPDNVSVAKVLSAKGIRIAYVDRSFAEGKDNFPTATRCPENNKAIALISDKGSACARCGLCVFGRKDVLFSTTKR